MGRYIPPELKDSIQFGNDIVEVISSYLPLKRAGRNYKALCPFHTEKTPSFSVNPEKQIFHCFGCGVGGDVFSFVMRRENLNFPEALALLARRAGIEIPESRPGARSRRERLLLAHGLAQEYYHRNLLDSPEGSRARRYLSGRKISGATIGKFKLGYAPLSWDGLLRYAAGKKQTAATLVEAGLAIPRRRGEGCYDRFRDRLVFPVFDVQGKTIAFGGRVLDDSQPKYINSPDTPLFEKGRVLYGLNFARDAIVREGRAIIGEGFFDVIRAHQEGVESMVCSQGTAFTPRQAQLLKRYTETIVTAFDADSAGEGAVFRGLSVFLEKNFEVRVLTLPSGHDPDSFISRRGVREFLAAAEQAVPLLDYLLEVLCRRFDASTDRGKLEITRGMFEAIGRLESPVLRDGYLLKLARRLGVEPGAVRAEFSGRGRKKRTAPARARPASGSPDNQRWLLRVLLTDDNIFDKIAGFVKVDDFSPPWDEIARKMIQLRESGEGSVSRHLLGVLTEEKTKSLAAGLIMDSSAPPVSLSEAADILINVRQSALRRRLAELADLIAEEERKGGDIVRYQRQSLQLRRELDGVSTELRKRIETV